MDFFDPGDFSVYLLLLIIWVPSLLLAQFMPKIGIFVALIMMGLLMTFADPTFAVPFVFVVITGAVMLWRGV